MSQLAPKPVKNQSRIGQFRKEGSMDDLKDAEPGWVLKFLVSVEARGFSTSTGKSFYTAFRAGEKVTLVEKTEQVPGGRIGPFGHNWKVRYPDGAVVIWDETEYQYDRSVLAIYHKTPPKI